MSDDDADACYNVVDRAVSAALDQLRDVDLCPCCMALVLFRHGASLAVKAAGPRAAVVALEMIVAELRRTPVN